MLALPVVLVARAGLGTINHTLLTLHVARSAGLTVAGVVVNRYRLEPPAGPDAPPPSTLGDDDYAIFTNPHQIATLGKTKVLALVPDEPENNVVNGTIGDDTQFTIDQVDWWRLARR
jgi:dethiobiotin synthetase